MCRSVRYCFRYLAATSVHHGFAPGPNTNRAAMFKSAKYIKKNQHKKPFHNMEIPLQRSSYLVRRRFFHFSSLWPKLTTDRPCCCPNRLDLLPCTMCMSHIYAGFVLSTGFGPVHVSSTLARLHMGLNTKFFSRENPNLNWACVKLPPPKYGRKRRKKDPNNSAQRRTLSMDCGSGKLIG